MKIFFKKYIKLDRIYFSPKFHYIFYLGDQLRILTVVIFQLMFVGEIVIYIKLYFTLWKHDEGMKDKITTDDLHQRKRKNIISLSGQVISFFVEFLTSLYILGIIFNQDLSDASLAPIVKITSTSIVSISQLWTSHELKRYIKSEFMDCNF